MSLKSAAIMDAIKSSKLHPDTKSLLAMNESIRMLYENQIRLYKRGERNLLIAVSALLVLYFFGGQ